MGRLLITLLLALLVPSAALAKDIAICGASEGYVYFPRHTGKWEPDGIKGGRVTLTRTGNNRFDLLFTDATGAVISAAGDGGIVLRVGQNKEAVSVIVNFPGATVETWTFIQSQNGAEAIWSSNKWGAPMPKVGAYRAPCSFLDLGIN